MGVDLVQEKRRTGGEKGAARLQIVFPARQDIGAVRFLAAEVGAAGGLDGGTWGVLNRVITEFIRMHARKYASSLNARNIFLKAV